MVGSLRALRSGFSLVEALVSFAIVCVVGASLMSLSSSETKGVSVSQDHLMASQLLDEIRQAFGSRPAYFYAPFPSPPASDQATAGPEFPGLVASLVEEDPVFTGRAPGFGAPPTEPEVALLAWMRARSVTRGVFQHPVTGSRDLEIIFRVQYRDDRGGIHFLESSEVIHR